MEVRYVEHLPQTISGPNNQRSWWKFFCRRSKRFLRVLDKRKVLSDLHSQRRSIRGRFSRDDAWLSFHEVRLGAGNSLVMNNEQHVYALRFDCDEGEDALTGVAFYIFSFIKTRQLSALCACPRFAPMDWPMPGYFSWSSP